ncbi:hypothetical protein SDC9_115992 [bioreactor metagenome]|uniref:Uncharacterized protein n=1 Tax=bioreactor metagenome TaxID=1076179 RepID=A0A645BVC6_9ZZZZ
MGNSLIPALLVQSLIRVPIRIDGEGEYRMLRQKHLFLLSKRQLGEQRMREKDQKHEQSGAHSSLHTLS